MRTVCVLGVLALAACGAEQVAVPCDVLSTGGVTVRAEGICDPTDPESPMTLACEHPGDELAEWGCWAPPMAQCTDGVLRCPDGTLPFCVSVDEPLHQCD